MRINRANCDWLRSNSRGPNLPSPLPSTLELYKERRQTAELFHLSLSTIISSILYILFYKRTVILLDIREWHRAYKAKTRKQSSQSRMSKSHCTGELHPLIRIISSSSHRRTTTFVILSQSLASPFHLTFSSKPHTAHHEISRACSQHCTSPCQNILATSSFFSRKNPSRRSM